MKKVLVSIEMNIDEEELKKIENFREDYEQNMTLEKWVDGLKIVCKNESTISIGNDIEYYYNVNLGNSQALQSIEVKGMKIIE